MLWMFLVIRVTLFWGGLTGVVFAEVMNKPEPILIFLGVSLAVAILVFAYIHHFLLGKPPKRRWPKKVPTPISLWEGFYASVVMILSLAVGTACVLPFHDFSAELTQERLETEGGWFGLIWFITAVYSYQAEFLMRRRHNKNRAN